MFFVLSIINFFFWCQGYLCVTPSLFCSGNFLLVIWEKKTHLVIPHGYRKMVCLTPVPTSVVVWCIKLFFYYLNQLFLDRGIVVLANRHYYYNLSITMNCFFFWSLVNLILNSWGCMPLTKGKHCFLSHHRS